MEINTGRRLEREKKLAEKQTEVEKRGGVTEREKEQRWTQSDSRGREGGWRGRERDENGRMCGMHTGERKESATKGTE